MNVGSLPILGSLLTLHLLTMLRSTIDGSSTHYTAGMNEEEWDGCQSITSPCRSMFPTHFHLYYTRTSWNNIDQKGRILARYTTPGNQPFLHFGGYFSIVDLRYSLSSPQARYFEITLRVASYRCSCAVSIDSFSLRVFK